MAEINKVTVLVFGQEYTLSGDMPRDYVLKLADHVDAKMKEIDGAKEGFQFLADHFDTYILSTAPWNNPSAWCDKLEWVKTHLGPAVKKRLILSHHKDLLRGDYIIDDNTNNGVADFLGVHIHFGSPEFPNWQAVIEYFQRLL